MDSRVCHTLASGLCLFGFSAPVSSSHHSFVAVALKFVRSLNHFSSCSFPGCYILGCGLWPGNSICSHMVGMVANWKVNSKQEGSEGIMA